MPITAHVTCVAKVVSTDSENTGWAELSFQIDKADERNAAWRWDDTPRLALGLTTSAEVAAKFEHGQSYTITIAEED